MKSDEARNLISGIGDSFISEAMPERFRRHRTRRGWIAAAACFAVIVGIIGEYIAILFSELKDRPIYIVKSTENMESEEKVTKS